MPSHARAAQPRKAMTHGSRSNGRDIVPACRSARSCMSRPTTSMYFPTMSSTSSTCRRPSSCLAPAETQGQFKFDAWRLSLAEAIGKQGGLNDSQADPAAVYLYRGETRAVAREIGVDVTPFQGEIIPIIFHVNLRDPSGYFLAQSFEMRNKDVIYTSNAVSVETTKFLVFLRTILATVNDPIIYATNFYALKAAAQTGSTTIITTPTPITTTAP